MFPSSFRGKGGNSSEHFPEEGDYTFIKPGWGKTLPYPGVGYVVRDLGGGMVNLPKPSTPF